MAKLVVSGTSGAGKSTLIRRFLKDFPKYRLSISCTTRRPRKDEKNGRDYHFITKDEFKQKIKNDEFIEYVEYNNELYGTLKSEIGHENVILDVERNGVLAIKEIERHMDKVPPENIRRQIGFIYIFVYCEFNTLKERLIERERCLGQNSTKDVNLRLNNYCEDKKLFDSGIYDVCIVNNNINMAYDMFKRVAGEYSK
ncbi:Guanylate kinase [Dictyocoela roeselum]|nr:Guanylate kinase [Dictyocoela roeselum]